MNLFKFRVALAGLLCVLATGQASAQFPRPGGQVGPVNPVFSPYLNMLRTDSPPAINYFGLVRPQITAQARFGALQQEIMATQQQQQGTSELPITGQPAYFLNTGGYFMNYQVGAGSGANRLPGNMTLPGGQGTIIRPTNATLPYRR